MKIFLEFNLLWGGGDVPEKGSMKMSADHAARKQFRWHRDDMLLDIIIAGSLYNDDSTEVNIMIAHDLIEAWERKSSRECQLPWNRLVVLYTRRFSSPWIRSALEMRGKGYPLQVSLDFEWKTKSHHGGASRHVCYACQARWVMNIQFGKLRQAITPGGGALSLHMEMCLYTRLEIKMCLLQKLK